jgi:hypothetical protein
MSAASITARVRVADFDAWKAVFDEDTPGAREQALGWTLYRGAEDPNEVFIRVDFASVDAAKIARDRVLASGVLDRIPDHTGPTVVQHAETRTR